MPDSIRAGLQLAFAYDPLIALAAAAVVAGILARLFSPMWVGSAACLLALAWWVGGGSAAYSDVRELYALGQAAASVAAGIGALGSAALGFVLPVWAGVFVGRRVTWGTGWLSAAAVAAMLSRTMLVFGAAIVG